VNLAPVSSKHLSELEQLVSQVLATMRKAKLSDETIYATLQEFEQELGSTRRDRFDADNSEYSGY